MNKLKLMTIIGTRPEIIRLSAVIKKCDVYFDQILVHTGQNYDYNLNQVFFEDLGLRAPNFYLDTLTKATNLVLAGAKLIGTNFDMTGPSNRGIIPACRALISPIEMATGKQAYFVGKPNPLMMRTGLRMLHCHSAEAVMVGDRMDTDVISGMESGMSTVLVLSGVSTRETLKTYAYRPSIVLDGVGDIAAMARM